MGVKQGKEKVRKEGYLPASGVFPGASRTCLVYPSPTSVLLRPSERVH